MWKAYRQVPVAEDKLRFVIVAIWHPHLSVWVFYEADALLFGLSGAVLHFNRVPAHAIVVARRWLAIPVQGFFDDFRIIDIIEAQGSADRWFSTLMTFLGWRLDPDKRQLPSPKVLLIGVTEDYGHCSDACVLSPKPGRDDKIIEQLKEIIRTHRCTQETARTVLGRIINLADIAPGRMCKGILFELTHRCRSREKHAHFGLVHQCSFLVHLLKMRLRKVIPLVQQVPLPRALWTDASCHIVNGQSQARVCILVAALDVPQREGIVIDLSAHLLASLISRETQIFIAEVLGPVLALNYFPTFFRDATLMAFRTTWEFSVA
jgi:hypothetical protein